MSFAVFAGRDFGEDTLRFHGEAGIWGTSVVPVRGTGIDCLGCL